jgi:hypothetical protein
VRAGEIRGIRKLREFSKSIARLRFAVADFRECAGLAGLEDYAMEVAAGGKKNAAVIRPSVVQTEPLQGTDRTKAEMFSNGEPVRKRDAPNKGFGASLSEESFPLSISGQSVVPTLAEPRVLGDFRLPRPN